MPRPSTPEDRARVGDLVRRKRGRTTIETIAARAPMSPVTWGKVEAGDSVRASTYGAVENAFGWLSGAIDRFVDTGEEPIAGTALLRNAIGDGPKLAMIDAALQLDLPDAIKVDLVWVVRSEGNPIDAILTLDRDDHHKVGLVAAYREIEERLRGEVRSAS